MLETSGNCGELEHAYSAFKHSSSNLVLSLKKKKKQWFKFHTVSTAAQRKRMSGNLGLVAEPKYKLEAYVYLLRIFSQFSPPMDSCLNVSGNMHIS